MGLRARTTRSEGDELKIAIIGAGNVGSAVARGAAQAGHQVTLTASDPAHAQKAADEVGSALADTAAEAVRDSAPVVLAVPYNAVADGGKDIDTAVAGKTGIDATNPLKRRLHRTRRHRTFRRRGDPSAATERARVKAFNMVFASKQADPIVDGDTLDGFYASDPDDAKRMVAELLSQIGFRPNDASPLSAARSLEHMAFLNISLNARNGWSWQSGWKLVGPTG